MYTLFRDNIITMIATFPWFLIYLLVFSLVEATEIQDRRIESIKQDFFIDLTNVLRGKHVFMLGDSLMRYHYLSIAYLLRHHHPVSQSMKPNMVEEKTWGNFHEFFLGSNYLLHPFERCDCYREEHTFPDLITENRYFSDPVHTINITYFQYFGFTCHGRWWPESPIIDSDLSVRPTHLPHRWSMSLEQTITEFNRYRKSPASILILNVGFWNDANGRTGLFYMNESLVEAASKNFKHVIWKTTNYLNPSSRIVLSPIIGEMDQYWCSRPSVHCLNLSWTKDLLPEEYWDPHHFRAKVYYRMTAQLVELLQRIDQ